MADDVCPDCGGELRFLEKDTSSGREYREYRCTKCGKFVTLGGDVALWQLLHDANEEARGKQQDAETKAGSDDSGIRKGSRIGPETGGAPRTFKPKLGHVMAVLSILVFGYLFYRMISNGNNLREFCASVKPGMTREQLETAVQATQLEERYGQDDPKADSAVIRVPGAYPPNQCYVEFEGRQVKSAGFVPYR